MLISEKLVVGSFEFVWGSRTYIMGILNATPDSFSGDGLYSESWDDKSLTQALKRAENFLNDGADILDVGGESTRPGAYEVSADAELKRVIPLIEALRKEFDCPISIDTYKSSVAREAIDAGAQIVNDVWGLRADPEMAQLVAEKNVPVIIMHNRSKPTNAEVRERLGGRYVGVNYRELIMDIRDELTMSIDIAHRAGVPDEKIIIDPGIGFGKTVEQNLELINRLGEIKSLGYPLLLGPSRKSFIGYTLDLPPDQRVEGTGAAVAIGIDRGADIIRVHDVLEMFRVAKITDAIVRRSVY